jgi:hypothetical protein
MGTRLATSLRFRAEGRIISGSWSAWKADGNTAERKTAQQNRSEKNYRKPLERVMGIEPTYQLGKLKRRFDSRPT